MRSLISFAFLAVLAAAMLFLAGCATTSVESFISSSTLSVSKTTLNGQDIVLVLMNAGGQGDAIIADLTRALYPQFDSGKQYRITVQKTNDLYTYTATDRIGQAGTAVTYELRRSCEGVFGCSSIWGLHLSIDEFKSECKANSTNNIFVDAGDVLNPKWRCYESKPKWLISDFNMVGGTSNPSVVVIVDEYQNAIGSAIVGQYKTTLSATHTQDVLSYGGATIGTASIPNLVSTPMSPPSSSGIKALRPAGQTSGYMVVSGELDAEKAAVIDTFQECLDGAKNPSGGQAVAVIPFFPVGFTYSESMDDQEARTCIDQYNSGITGLAYLSPQGDFQGGALDLSKLNDEKKVSLKNLFTIPQVKLELIAEKVGIERPIAAPQSVSCNDKELPGGSTIGEFTTTVTNGNTAGLIYVEASCTSPLTVRTSAGSYYFNAGETKQLSTSVSIGPDAANSTCTVTAKSGDLAKSISNTCKITQTAACTNTPRPNFYLDKNCVEYCPLTVADCPSPKVLKNPATGYSNLCVCEDAANLTPAVCNNNGVCETGETLLNCPNDCMGGGGGVVLPEAKCNEFFEKATTQTVGGYNILFWNIGGTQAGKCVPNYVNIGAVLLAIGAALFLGGLAIKQKATREPVWLFAGLFIAAGLGAFLLSFLVENAGMLLVAGAGLALLVVAVVAILLIIKK